MGSIPTGSSCAPINDLRNCFVQRRRVDCSCSTGNVNFCKCTAKDLVPSKNFPTTTHAPHSHTTTLSNISYRQGHLRQPRFRGKAFHSFDQGPRARRSHVLQACNCCSPSHSGCEPMSLPSRKRCLHPAPRTWMPPFGSSLQMQCPCTHEGTQNISLAQGDSCAKPRPCLGCVGEGKYKLQFFLLCCVANARHWNLFSFLLNFAPSCAWEAQTRGYARRLS